MLSRRSFLWLSSLATGFSFVPRPSWAQRPAAPMPATLPPSIATLTSLKNGARPITNDERLNRVARARTLMADSRIDAMMLTGGTSLVYFTNIRWGLSERLFAMLLPAKGDPFFVCPAFEADRAQEQIALSPFAGHADLRTWEEDESPYALVARGLADRGVATGALGVEETVRFVFSDGVAQAAPGLKLVSATPVTAGCRMIKDAHEIALMRLAAKVTLTAYAAAFKALKDGMTQNDFGGLVAAAHTKLGFPGGCSVQVGQYTALPHGSITPQRIREGSIVLIDGGCSVEGYSSDISRTFILGKPTDKMKQVFDIVHRAQTAAMTTAKPGLPLDAVDAAARKVIVDAGYGPGFKYFTHRVGHGLGMDGHEWAYLVRNNMFGWTKSLTLQPAMTFSDEPGIYIREEFGVRLEDDLLITDGGAELLTPQSPSLDQPFANVT